MTATISHYSPIYYKIAPEIFERLPDAKVGVALVWINIQKKPDDKSVVKYLSDLKQRVVKEYIDQDITSANYIDSAACKSWQRVFGTFGVEADKKCTIEQLLRRTAVEADKIRQFEKSSNSIKKADLGRVSNIVDLCNCVSIRHQTPMGVLDLAKISDGIDLRNGKEGDFFIPLGEKCSYEVKPQHIVIADSKNVLAWLWTYKVAQHCCVQDSAKDSESCVLVCADQAEKEGGDAETAIKTFLQELPNIRGRGQFLGVLNKENPAIKIEPSK